MSANRYLAIGFVAAHLALASAATAHALESTPTKPGSPLRAACKDLGDTFFLHVAVGAPLDVDEYVETVRDLARPRAPRLAQALSAYDHSTTIRDYERAIRRVVAWCTRTLGRL